MQVGTTELSTILGVTARQVTSLSEQGVIPKAGRGQWPLAETVQAYIRHKVQSEVGRAKRPVAAGTDRLKDIKARREELKLAREEGVLVPVSDALYIMDVLSGALTLQMNNIPARFTRDLDERDRLQGHIDEALTTIAKKMTECGAELEKNRGAPGAPPAEPEDDAEA